MAIKQLLELIGDDIVIAKLDKVQKKGEEALGSFNKSTSDVKLNVDSGPIEETTGHVVKLTEVLHTLRPVLQTAGLQFSEFGALTRLAGTSLLALAAATTGAVVVGLARLEENAARTKGVLADLFGSSAKGEQAFGALEKQAKQFGTSVEELAPGLESFQQALNNVDRTAQGFRALKEEDLPGAELAKNVGAVTAAYDNFIKLLKAGRLDADQANKSAKAFFDTLKDTGFVTSAALKNLPVGTINLLKEAFGQAGLTAKQFFALADTGAISLDALEKALINFGPQAQKAFETKAIKSFSEEFSKILTVLKEGFKSLTGTELSDFLNNELKKFREGLQGFLADLKAIRDFVRSGLVAVLGEPGFKQNQGFDEAGFIAFADTIKTKVIPGSVDASNSIQKMGAAALSAGQIATKAVDGISASLQGLRDKAKETGEEMQSVIIGGTEFKGRLDQIRVSRPQLAGEFDPVEEAVKQADAAAKAAKAAFKDNQFFKDGITIKVNPVLDQEKANTLFKDIKPTIPAEAQKEVVNQFKKAIEPIEDIPLPIPRPDFEGINKVNQIIEDTLKKLGAEDPIKIPVVPDVQPLPTNETQTLTDNFKETGTESGQAFSAEFATTVPEVFPLFQALYEQIKGLFATPIPVNFDARSPLQSTAPFASGGMVRGRGSTTSDSILAWLSNQEFVVNARAVSHYGPDLFAALNAMRLPRDFISRFSMGGFARAISGNRFASGGQVTAQPTSTLVLNIGGRSFEAKANEATITSLRRFAVNSQLASIGRKPGFVR